MSNPKVLCHLDAALLKFQVLGEKPEKGKTPLVWTEYVSCDDDPLAACEVFAIKQGFQKLDVELEEGVAWRGFKTIMNKTMKSAQTFFAEIKITHSLRIAKEPAAEIPTVQAVESDTDEQS